MTEHHWIFIVSADFDTQPNKDDEDRENQLHRNEIRADRRRNEAAIRQSEHEMQDTDRERILMSPRGAINRRDLKSYN